MFPYTRLRRNRKSEWIRDIVSESKLLACNLILPIFVIDGFNRKEEISSMQDVFRVSIDMLIETCKEAQDLGIKAIMLFPNVEDELKTKFGEESHKDGNLISRAISAIKNSGLTIGVICDVALDPYTNHGHDGIVIDNDVDNDRTIEILQKQSLLLANVGADIIAPSDMMDGRILKIRECLDRDGFHQMPIMSYSAKYASAFYSPFREAVNSNKDLKIDKKTYQMDVRNAKEAIREIELDIAEGADIVMIKPAMTCLDIIYTASVNFDVPIFAYQVSGEYSMLKNASKSKILDFDACILESLSCIKRAGARSIVTYSAMHVAKLLSF